MERVKSRKNCCVPGCQDRSSERHRFPITKPEIFHEWLKAINHPPFFHMPPLQLYNSHYVCHRHFSEDVTINGTQRGLKVSAIPTLFLQENIASSVNEEKLKVYQNGEEVQMCSIKTEVNENFRNLEVNITSSINKGNLEISQNEPTEMCFIKVEESENVIYSLKEPYLKQEDNHVEIKSEILNDTTKSTNLEQNCFIKNELVGYFNLNTAYVNARIPATDCATEIETVNKFEPLLYDSNALTQEHNNFENFKSRKKTVTSQKRGSYKKRERSTVVEIKYSCTTCLETFTEKEMYEDHLDIHPPCVCEICGKGFRRKESLKAHRITHNDPNTYICEVCGRGFKDSGALRCHIKTHTRIESYACDKCPKVFASKPNLRVHIKFVHDKIQNNPCPHCDIQSRDKAALKKHIRLVHLGEKPYECDICQRKFGRRDYLQQHRAASRCKPGFPGESKPRATNKLGLFEGKRAANRNNKRWEISEEKSTILKGVDDDVGSCKFCGKVINDKVSLKRHMLVHINRYRCSFCPQTFYARCVRNEHELVHQDAPQFFRCDVCYKKFNTKEELEGHAATQVHRRRPKYSCDTCGEKFHRRFILSQHILTEHSTTKSKVLDTTV